MMYLLSRLWVLMVCSPRPRTVLSTRRVVFLASRNTMMRARFLPLLLCCSALRGVHHHHHRRRRRTRHTPLNEF
uniref:Putative secreted protein n=1 Tax=Anopheles triannulatus TaxID=58253 RepID=A0A2M4B722_9DIPT